MTSRLEADMARWETGELSLNELRARHPGSDVDALVAVHGHLSHLVDTPTPDAAAAWTALAGQLPAQPDTPRARVRRSRRAVVVAIIAAVIAVPAVSYAAAPDAVRAVAREVRDLLPGTNNDGDYNNRDNDNPTTTTPSTAATDAVDNSGTDQPVQDNNDDPSMGSNGNSDDTWFGPHERRMTEGEGPNNEVDDGADPDGTHAANDDSSKSGA